MDIIKVWDLPLRLFHWFLVLFFITTFISGENENEIIHEFAGYCLVALLCFRFLWGMMGSKYARFSHFIYGPREIIQYSLDFFKRRPKHYLGHNPLASLMVFALLSSLIITSWSGLKLYAAEGYGPLVNNVDFTLIGNAVADDDGHEDEDDHEEQGQDEFWEEIHEIFSHITLLLVVLHVFGVIVASWVHKENLLIAMINGKKTT